MPATQRAVWEGRSSSVESAPVREDERVAGVVLGLWISTLPTPYNIVHVRSGTNPTASQRFRRENLAQNLTVGIVHRTYFATR